MAGDPAHQFGTRRGGEPPARSIDREGVDLRPALRGAGLRNGPLPVPASFGQRLVAGISRPFERLRGHNSGEGAVLRQAARGRARASSRPRRARAARRILRHRDAARRPGPIRGSRGRSERLSSRISAGKLRLGAEGREKRGQKQDSFHRPCILSSTSPAAPMHPGAVAQPAATSSVSSPQTDIICRRTPSRSFAR